MTDLETTKQQAYEETIKVFEGFVQEYNAQEFGVPDRLRIKAQAILGASSLEQVQQASRKARESGLMHYLHLWAKKRITGKVTEANAEQKARKAENLADHLDTLGQCEAATKQRERATELRNMVRLKS